MLVGRLLGWVMIGLAAVMASADAVMALGPAEYAGIATAEMVTLLTGDLPSTVGVEPSLFAAAKAMVLQLPAWVAVGALGLAIMAACRRRHDNRRRARSFG